MKKISILLCVVLVLQMLSGCFSKEEDFREPINFYYYSNEVNYNSSTGIICPEVREGAGYHGNLTGFLQSYLNGPKSSAVRKIIPSDVYLVSCELNDDVIKILFSKSFENLSGIDLSVACCALLLTVHDYTGVNTIVISAKDGKIDDKDSITFTMDDIVLMDHTM